MIDFTAVQAFEFKFDFKVEPAPQPLATAKRHAACKRQCQSGKLCFPLSRPCHGQAAVPTGPVICIKRHAVFHCVDKVSPHDLIGAIAWEVEGEETCVCRGKAGINGRLQGWQLGPRKSSGWTCQ